MGIILRSLSLRLRRLSTLDHASVIDHLLRLEDNARYTRFLYSISDVAITRYVYNIDFKRDLCFGALNKNQDLLGFIHISFANKIGELGASVDTDWRNCGIARALFRRALRTAKMIGIREIHLATGHAGALRICADLGYHIETRESHPKMRILLRKSFIT